MPRGGRNKGGGNLKVVWCCGKRIETKRKVPLIVTLWKEAVKGAGIYPSIPDRSVGSTADSGSLLQLPANQTLGSSGDDSVAGFLAPTWEIQMGEFRLPALAPHHSPVPVVGGIWGVK